MIVTAQRLSRQSFLIITSRCLPTRHRRCLGYFRRKNNSLADGQLLSSEVALLLLWKKENSRRAQEQKKHLHADDFKSNLGQLEPLVLPLYKNRAASSAVFNRWLVTESSEGARLIWQNEILGVTTLKISEIKSIKDNSKLATFQTKEQKQSLTETTVSTTKTIRSNIIPKKGHNKYLNQMRKIKNQPTRFISPLFSRIKFHLQIL